MIIQTILALVNVILLIVSVSVNNGLFTINFDNIFNSQIGVYKYKYRGENLETRIESVNCSDTGFEQFKDVGKSNLENFSDTTDDIDTSYCETIQIVSPILIVFNVLIFMLAGLIKIKALKQTRLISVLIKLLSTITICLNLVLIVIIILYSNSYDTPFFDIIETYMNYGFYLICVSLVISLISFIAYLRHPVKKG